MVGTLSGNISRPKFSRNDTITAARSEIIKFLFFGTKKNLEEVKTSIL
jgi:hypothetical protein